MRTVIVDDVVIIREHLRIRCAATGLCQVVAESGTAREAGRLIAECEPDLVLLDIGLPDADGFSVAEQARKKFPELRVLIISGYLNEYVFSRCEAIRVQGFLDKQFAPSSELDIALCAITAGRTYFTAAYENARRRWQGDPRAISKRLSPREVEVMRLVARGLNDAEISRKLDISETTAATHRGKIMRNLNLPSTPKLITHATERGFGRL